MRDSVDRNEENIHPFVDVKPPRVVLLQKGAHGLGVVDFQLMHGAAEHALVVGGPNFSQRAAA
jgi:hypothetical protein